MYYVCTIVMLAGLKRFLFFVSCPLESIFAPSWHSIPTCSYHFFTFWINNNSTNLRERKRGRGREEGREGGKERGREGGKERVREGGREAEGGGREGGLCDSHHH